MFIGRPPCIAPLTVVTGSVMGDLLKPKHYMNNHHLRLRLLPRRPDWPFGQSYGGTKNSFWVNLIKNQD